MNFLAHLFLSGNNEKIMVGNFLGDFVKGKDLKERFHPEIAQGIALHRGIDVFTDKHLTVQQSKERIRPKYGHYTPVVVDMFYDHLLAKHWENFHPKSLEDFTHQAYRILENHISIFPNEAKLMFPFMKNSNWLLQYANLEGINQALTGMAKRTKFQSNMEEATQDLEKYYEDFKNEFLSFFPEVICFASDFLNADNRA